MSSHQDLKTCLDLKRNSHTLKVPFDIKHKEVEQWLVSLYGSLTAVPEYEKTNASIELLYNLMTACKDTEKRTVALTNDFTNKAEEYRAQACEKASILQGVHLSKNELSEPALEALENIACTANAVNAQSASETDVMLAYAHLETEHAKVMQQCSSKLKARAQLLNLSQEMAQKIDHAKSLEQQAEATSKVQQRDTKLNVQKEHFYERKLQEYEAEVASMEAELIHRGYHADLSHSALCKEYDDLKKLESQVNDLEKQLECYSLPPDINAARLAVKQLRDKLDSLINNIASEQQQKNTF